MALTVNPDAGAGGLDTFREEGLYAFRFDLNDDAREEVTFKIRFGEVMHAAGEQRLGGFHQITPTSLKPEITWPTVEWLTNNDVIEHVDLQNTGSFG